MFLCLFELTLGDRTPFCTAFDEYIWFSEDFDLWSLNVIFVLLTLLLLPFYNLFRVRNKVRFHY